MGKKSPDEQTENAGEELDLGSEPGEQVEDAAEEHAVQVDGDASSGETGAEEVLSALQIAEDEIGRHKDALIRQQAEMDNQRKRMAREVERARKFGLDRFMNDLLPVHDSLERSLQTPEDQTSEEMLREGSDLTLRLLLKTMQSHGLEIIDPEGESFDPDWHEAISVQENAEYPANTVTVVVQKGFKLNERLIRPAMVIVTPS